MVAGPTPEARWARGAQLQAAPPAETGGQDQQSGADPQAQQAQQQREALTQSLEKAIKLRWPLVKKVFVHVGERTSELPAEEPDPEPDH